MKKKPSINSKKRSSLSFHQSNQSGTVKEQLNKVDIKQEDIFTIVTRAVKNNPEIIQINISKVFNSMKIKG